VELDATKTGESAHHQGVKKEDGWNKNRTEDIVDNLKHICDYHSIYPQLVEFEVIQTICIYQCAWRNTLVKEILTVF